MFKPKSAFSGFSVNDLAKAKAFYAETLGLQVDDEGVGMRLHLPDGGTVFAYPKDDHQPATYTILNFVVENIDEAVDELTNRGVQFEHYEEGPKTDGKGILRGRALQMGPDIAWFKDPAGNTLAVLQVA
ncbi:MAG TPA: glyoxalase [Ktedonobacter sp.]|jgi:catechol 2,3-dioxygenase-like lactoylglutathione lyase family enzyme|nr:glyoxalase [Ktedonobacter sp.]